MTIAPFETKDFNSQLQRTLGKVYVGGASVGEVMATAAAIEDGNLKSWHDAWRGRADSLEHRAGEARAAGQSETARGLYLRASEAFRQAGFFHRVDLDCAELQAAWPRSAACMEAALELSACGTKALTIPFEGRSLHGRLMTPAMGDGPWPTLVMPSGYDGTAGEMVLMCGLSAVARGFAALVFDAPGQGDTLYDPETRAFMRPDFGIVMAAVLDTATSLPEIDNDRIAALGVSFGGYLVPRGASGESRLPALVADPGQFDIGGSLVAMLPQPLLDMLDEDSDAATAAFEKLAASPDGALLFRPRMAAHGAKTVQEYVRVMRDFHNRDAAAGITCPSLICDNEVDVVSTGQGHQLAEAMTGAEVEFVRFTAAEGAAGHCEGMGREVFDERVFPWLDRTLGRG